MRIAVLSDLHAHRIALDAVLGDAARAGAQGYLVLGDIVDLGPEPSAVVERVQALGCPVVRGNHDPLDERSPLPELEAMRAWTRACLSAAQRSWLEQLPTEQELSLDGLRLRAVHASPGSLTHPLLASTPDAELERWLTERPCDVLCCGHTHLPLYRRLGARAIVNVGSVGLPFSGPFTGGRPTVFPWAEYAILDAKAGRLAVDFRRVPYDFDRFLRVFRGSGFSEAEFFLDTWERP